MDIKSLLENLSLYEGKEFRATINPKNPERLKELENITGQEAYDKFGLKEDETIIETVKFENGYEADIKLVIPDEESYTWTEAVLFDEKGNQVAYTEPSDAFFGEWILEDDNDVYTIIVEG